MSQAGPLITSQTASKFTTPFRIIDEGPDFIVVDKAPFVQAHPSKPSDIRTLWCNLRDLLAYEIANGGQVSIINRLDRETSGLTLVAKTRVAAGAFCRQMEQRRVGKGYVAIVFGLPAKDRWTVDAPILRKGSVSASQIYLKQTVHPQGAQAVTDFEVIERITPGALSRTGFSVIRCMPHTGRMHQIRVHLAHSGHPLVGDKIYGEDETCYLEFIETGWTEALAGRLLLNRHALHAGFLRLEESGQEWTSPLPKDLEDFLIVHRERRDFAGGTKSSDPITRP